jgi:hypothetical protein
MTSNCLIEFSDISWMVREYQKEIVPLIDADSTSVPLAKEENFERLCPYPFVPMAE